MNSEEERSTDAEAEAGFEEVAEGLDSIAAARDAGAVSREAMAAGVSDMTRGVDAIVASERRALLSEAVAEAGIEEIEFGCFNQPLCNITVIRLKQIDLKAGLEDRQPVLCCGYADIGIFCNI